MGKTIKTCKEAVAKTRVSTRRSVPPVPVAGLVEQAKRGNGPAWNCGFKALWMFPLKGPVILVAATESEIPGGMSKAVLYRLEAKRQRKSRKERNKWKQSINQCLKWSGGPMVMTGLGGFRPTGQRVGTTSKKKNSKLERIWVASSWTVDYCLRHGSTQHCGRKSVLVGLPKARVNEIYRESLNLPVNKVDNSLRGEIFKIGDGVQCRALDVFSLS